MIKIDQCGGLTKMQLATLLFTSGTPELMYNGMRCILHQVQREDGSGRKFNLTLTHGRNTFSVYIHTID